MYRYEAYVSAENSSSFPPSRLSEAHEYCGWTQCDQKSSSCRKEKDDYGLKDMLPVAHRSRKYETSEVFRTGRPLFVMDLGARFKKNEQSITRFSFVVGKKMLSGAVSRNHFKRLLRESARLFQKNWPAGYTIVVFVARKPKCFSRQSVRDSLRLLLEKIH